MAERVASQHAGANKVIGAMREVAEQVKVLGEENVRLEAECDRALRDLAAERSAEERAQNTLAEWAELLCDFRQGIRDRDELLAETVGR